MTGCLYVREIPGDTWPSIFFYHSFSSFSFTSCVLGFSFDVRCSMYNGDETSSSLCLVRWIEEGNKGWKTRGEGGGVGGGWDARGREDRARGMEGIEEGIG